MCWDFHISKALCNGQVIPTLGALGNSSECRPEESQAKGTADLKKARNRIFVEVSGFGNCNGIRIIIAIVDGRILGNGCVVSRPCKPER